jgi:hypothetical protein
MFWTGILVGLFIGTFLDLSIGGFLAASRKGDELLAIELAQEKTAQSPALDKESLEL